MNIFVANFNNKITEDELEQLFDQYGTVDKVIIWTDWDTGESKGFEFVEMPNEFAAESHRSHRWKMVAWATPEGQ